MKKLILIGFGALFLSASAAQADGGLDQGLWWLYQLQYDKARADFKAFDKIMKRRGGKPPRQGDEIC